MHFTSFPLAFFTKVDHHTWGRILAAERERFGEVLASSNKR